MGKLKRECDNYVYSSVRYRMKDYEKIGDHTIKKFELVSEYAKGWAHKILGCSQFIKLKYYIKLFIMSKFSLIKFEEL